MLVAIGFGMGWIFIVLGLLIRTPMTVMTLGFTFLFPLVFASNIMVDPATMPGWLRAFVEVNPVSLMTTALRGLMAGTALAGRPGADRAGGADAILAPPTLWLYLQTRVTILGDRLRTLPENNRSNEARNGSRTGSIGTLIRGHTPASNSSLRETNDIGCRLTFSDDQEDDLTSRAGRQPRRPFRP